MDSLDLLIPITGDLNGTVDLEDYVAVWQGKLHLKLRLGSLIVRGSEAVFKLPSRETLGLLSDKLEGANIFMRVSAAGADMKGGFAYIIPPDKKNGIEIHRGKTKRRALEKGQGSTRFLSGGLFMEIDEETIAEIVETAESP